MKTGLSIYGISVAKVIVTAVGLKKLRKMNKCLDTLNKHVNFPNFYELKGVAGSQKEIGGMFCDNRM
jgi:hypothetical protein